LLLDALATTNKLVTGVGGYSSKYHDYDK